MLSSFTKPSSLSSSLHSSSTFNSNLSASPDLCVWHLRLGHAPIAVVQKIASLKPSLQHQVFSSFHVCPLAKQTRLPFHYSTKKTIASFELLHMDVWGPYKQCTYNGHRYFLTIVNNYTQMTWIFLLRYKSEVVTSISAIISLIKTQFSATVKTVRSDNGLEFLNSQCHTLFSSLGIIHMCAYSSTKWHC